jgi:hypothetical protein
MAGCAGAIATPAAVPILLLGGVLRPGDALLGALLLAVGAGAGVAVLVVSEAVARLASPPWRPPLLLGIGGATGLVVTGAVTWVWALLEGATPREAWEALAVVTSWVAGHLPQALPLAASFLLPTVVLGTVRTLERPPGAWAQALAGALAGVGSFCLLLAALGPPLQPGDGPAFLVLFALVPASVGPASALAERLERSLLAALGERPAS